MAFDTIYAEGQRRYVESLSAYARQFLERMEKPDVEEIDGIAPPVAIRQKNTTRNPRSTVATTTELYDFLRSAVGSARAGRIVRTAISMSSATQWIKSQLKLAALPIASRWYALFPLPPEKGKEISEELRERLFDLRKRGFTRLYQNAQVYEFSTPESLQQYN